MIPENWDETSFTSLENVPPAPSGTYNQPQMAQQPPAPPAVGAADQQSIVGMLMAAGLDPANAQAAATPETLNALGQILGLTTQGLIDVLTARSAVKSQFRVPMTMMRPVENNALKSSANASEALVNLLVTHNPAYLNAVDAFAEGFEDIKAHQVALMAGMRAAFDSMLRRFDPDELEERFNKRKSKSVLRMPGNMQNWEMYRTLYDEMTQDADANFQRLFGEEFARAYEEQMQRLTASRGRM
jgi:type VI secretion system FHA domain protein